MSDQPNDRELAWRVWGMAWPTVLHSLLETSMGTVDLVMVRPLGPDATAAVGIGRQVTFLVAAAAIAISTGVITLVSQSVGAGDRQRVRQIIWQSLALVLLLGLATGSLGFTLVGPLLVAMRASIATIALGTGYLHVYFGGIVLVWANFVLAAVFRGAGDARTPLRLGIVVNLVNVGLNYALIFGLGPIPAFGVTGAALATVIARGIGVSAYLFLLLPRVEWLAPDGIGRAVWDARTAKNVLRVGAPLAVAAVLRNSSRLVFLAIVGGGTAALTAQAAVGVGMQVRLIGILPALAFQTATAALVGQAIGRGAIPEAESLARQGLLLLGVLMGVITSALFVVAGPLAWLFVTEADLAGLTSTVIRWFAVAQLFSALAICTQGALNGGGDTRPAARYTLVSQWCLMLPLAAVLALPLGWGLNGALVAWVLAPALNFALTWRRFRLGIWKGAGS